MKSWRGRWSITQLCCSGVLVSTNRILALVTASQMACGLMHPLTNIDGNDIVYRCGQLCVSPPILCWGVTFYAIIMTDARRNFWFSNLAAVTLSLD